MTTNNFLQYSLYKWTSFVLLLQSVIVSYLFIFVECIRSSRNRSSKQSSPEGAFFILQLHDELIYEVNRHNVKCVANIVRTNMEHAMKLHVVMPVKVSVGPTWGKLEEVDL